MTFVAASDGPVLSNTLHDILLAVGMILTVVGSVYGARVAARASVKVAEVSTEVQAETVELERERVEADGLRGDLRDTRQELARVSSVVEAMRERERLRDLRDEADRSARIAHGGWDYNTVNVVHAHALVCPVPGAREVLLSIGQPPPMYAPTDEQTRSSPHGR